MAKERAQKMFKEYFKGKRLLPNVFLNGRNRISEMCRLYVPYWLFDCDAHADMVYDAEKKRTERRGEWEITRTAHTPCAAGAECALKAFPWTAA